MLAAREHTPQAAPVAEETLKLSEIFSSVQGEGPSAGHAAVFVRLALCNLRCTWCDTKYTWDFRAYRYEDEVQLVTVASVVERVAAAPERRLIVTGGEPLLQQGALGNLVSRLPQDVHIEIETNGTLQPNATLLSRVNQWNVSPKLAHSGEPERRRLRLPVLRQLCDTGRATLKLVVDDPADAEEIEALVTATAWPRARVQWMPRAATRLEYTARAEPLHGLATQRGYGFSPRLHVLWWNGSRGR